jgi:hypothetical protein
MAQMKNVHCGKCGAGASSFECRREHLVNGTVLLVISCCLCGWRLERDERVHQRLKAARSLPLEGSPRHRPESLTGISRFPNRI